AQGFSNAAYAGQEAQQQAMQQALLRNHLMDQRQQLARAALQRSVNQAYIDSQPPEVQARLRVLAANGMLGNFLEMQSRPFMPHLQKRITGNNTIEQGYFPPNGDWVPTGSGPRFAPQQPQRTSPSDILGPLVAKMSRGETLTPAEKSTLDYW